MDEEVYEDIDSTSDATEEVVNTEEVEVDSTIDETEDESTEDNGYDPELIEKNKKLFERAKKAEAELKALKAKPQPKAEPSEKQDGLSTMDAMALINAKVTEKEDIEIVQKYARLNNIDILDALKDNVVKAILKDKQEQRTTAQATNTGTVRRGSSKPTSDQILTGVAQGKFPENPEDLAEARLQAKKKK